MSAPSGFQLGQNAAEIYEACLVPAIFAEWAPRIVDAGQVSEGQRVLDLGCGTGVVARVAQTIVGTSGRVVGADLSSQMLEVARDRAPEISWCRSDACACPLPTSASRWC